MKILLLILLWYVMMIISVLPMSVYPVLDVSIFLMFLAFPKICVTLLHVFLLRVVFKPISLKNANTTINVILTTVVPIMDVHLLLLIVMIMISVLMTVVILMLDVNTKIILVMIITNVLTKNALKTNVTILPLIAMMTMLAPLILALLTAVVNTILVTAMITTNVLLTIVKNTLVVPMKKLTVMTMTSVQPIAVAPPTVV
jgi:hypothetical protein